MMLDTLATSPQQPSQHLRSAAEALLARYPSVPSSETESGIALLALWALDAVESGHLAASEADGVFTLLDIELDEDNLGPDLSDHATQLLVEGMTLHDLGTPFGADLTRMRTLAFQVLAQTV